MAMPRPRTVRPGRVLPSDLKALKNLERGLEEGQRSYDKEFPGEQLEDQIGRGPRTRRTKFSKGGMVKGRDYCK